MEKDHPDQISMIQKVDKEIMDSKSQESVQREIEIELQK